MLTKRKIDILLLGVFAFLFYFIYRWSYFLGDACIYADNILRTRFNDISIHIGYYFIGYIFHKILSLFNAPVDVSLILMSNIFGAVGVVFAYLFVYEILYDHKLSIICAAILLFSGTYVEYSTQAEIYIPQVAFILASMYLFYKERNILSGLLYAAALLITPISVFVLPYYIFIAVKRRSSIKEMLYFIIPFMVIYLPIFLSIYNELLWGRRGLLRISSNLPYNSLKMIVSNIVFVLIKSFNILAPFVLIGHIIYWFKDKSKFLLLCILWLSYSYVIAKLSRFDLETAFLPIFVYFALLILNGIVFINIYLKNNLKIGNAFGMIILPCYIILSVMIWIGPAKIFHPQITPDNNFKNEMLAFKERISDNDILIASFWHGVAFAFYTRYNPEEEIETTMGNQRWIDIDQLNVESVRQLLNEFADVYVMEAYAPSAVAKVIFDEKELEDRYFEQSLKAQIENMASNIKFHEYFKKNDIMIYRLDRSYD